MVGAPAWEADPAKVQDPVATRPAPAIPASPSKRTKTICPNSFRNLWNRQARGLDFFGPQPMTRDVDHVIYTAENSIVAVRRQHRAVRRVVWPVPPIFAVGILAIFFVILAYETIRAAPDGLHDSRPGIADANVPRCARSGFHFLAFFIPDDRVNSQRWWSSAAGLHRVERGLCCARGGVETVGHGSELLVV